MTKASGMVDCTREPVSTRQSISRFQKCILSLYIVVFFLFAFPAFFFANEFAVALGYSFVSTGAKMEFIGAYGGLILGVGAFLLYCLFSSVKTGLIAVLAVVGCLFAGRLVGLAVEGESNVIQNIFLFVEAITIVLVSVALSRRVPLGNSVN